MPVGPFADWPEKLVSERLAVFMSANADAMNSIRPPIPNIGKVAPRFGYDRRPLGIADVVKITDVNTGPNTDPLSQRPGYTASALPGWSNA